ncbi:MAG: FAD-dependent oxidoreductase [Flavobacteriales bacterium]|nr:FAD-dependent oxidoreductase [Flavobacteriales bacterium]
MQKDVVVIGGGIIGLFSAYYLRLDGHDVTLIDRGDFNSGCSHQNAGMIVPSHLVPLASPGMITQGIKWMFNPKSPFYIKAGFNKDLIRWGNQFRKASTEAHVQNSIPALHDLSLYSKSLYQQLATQEDLFRYREDGLLMLYQSNKSGKEEIEAAEIAINAGLRVSILSQSQVEELEPQAKPKVIGGVLYHSDAHLDPQKLMRFLRAKVEQMGVDLQPHTEVKDLELRGNQIETIITSKGEIKAREIVLAGGAWNTVLAKKLNLDLSLMPGKGYSFTTSTMVNSPTIPSILCEGKVAVSPLGNKVRFGGTMEITRLNDDKINLKRVAGIVETIQEFYPDLKIEMPEEKEIWYGFRPCSPDGLPYLGRSKKVSNLTIAGGHAMMGLSLAPASGKIVSDLISSKNPVVNLQMFEPEREI